MYVVFLFPLLFSIIAAFGVLFGVLFGDHERWTQVIVPVLVLISVCLQFVPYLNENVHFLVPLFMQLILSGWYYLSMQMRDLNDF